MRPDSTVKVAAGPQYKRGAVHRFFWGRHYRNVWAEPVTAPVFNIRTAVPGGLTPVREGGSFQTRNLRLVDRNGVQYVLRSVDKDPTKALPEGLQNGPIGSLMKDQTSVIHPYGAYIVPVLAEAAGLYHTNPRLVFVPDDPALGEFQKVFANQLYLFEERPEGDQSAVSSFGRSTNVESSRKVFTNLLASAQYQVDARQYLRNRLFDMWLGDWSRREDQWRWASFAGQQGATVYRAIPRDRDHAFFKFDDGFLTHIIAWVKSNYQSFHEKIRLQDVEGLNRAARPMDKSLLAYLTREDFRQIADSLRNSLPDPVIAEALNVWPREVQALSASEFTRKLQARRDQLPAVANKFYELLAEEVELPGTDEAERFVVEAVGPGQVRVQVFRLLPTGENLLSQRTFDARLTKTIRLFGLGGNDAFEIRGTPDPKITIGIYDGAGQDLIGTTNMPAEAKSSITVYDSGDGNTLPANKAVKVEKYQPRAEEFDAAGWLLRHRLY
ncbi:hypothetical protein HMJ29_17280 [Hymenobacter taeanensis]|uniref:Uncharacterized protein n=1 Tax=Hymenobacter taeanensis TaxID=2735321 RepID=A0A6M6BND8_9BACT|nr:MULTISPECIES: hypothetical protein [Hymenobacter]QJX48575.1 hypothetical protein HMJ29_17280 [Hymenobacter taeanensis]UOQ81926.1 hypothetical protein MUN83_03815 [Hymenobacter sp. 5414T-23]